MADKSSSPRYPSGLPDPPIFQHLGPKDRARARVRIEQEAAAAAKTEEQDQEPEPESTDMSTIEEKIAELQKQLAKLTNSEKFENNPKERT